MSVPSLREWGIEVPVIPPGPCRVLVLGMHKGGTGKSTVTAGLAQVAAIGLRESHPLESQILRGRLGATAGTRSFVNALLAEATRRLMFSQRSRTLRGVAKRRILVIDLDPQGSVGAILQAPPPMPGRTLREVLEGVCDVKEALVKIHDHLHLLPSGHTLSTLDRRLGPAHEVLLDAGLARREGRAFPREELDRALREMEVLKRLVERLRPDYARILIDTPHAWTTLTAGALLAADEVLGVCRTDRLSAREVGEFVQVVNEARLWNPALTLLGVVLNFYVTSSRRHEAIRASLLRDGLVLTTTLPARMQIASLAERTLTLRTHVTMRHFTDLLTEVLQREHNASQGR